MRPTHRSPDGLCIAAALVLVALLSSRAARAIELLDVNRSTRITAVYFHNPSYPPGYPVTTSEFDRFEYGHWYSSLRGGDDYPVEASQDSLVQLTVGAYVVGSMSFGTGANMSGNATVGVSTSLEGASSIYQVLFTLDAMTEYAFAVDNLNPGLVLGSPVGGFVRLDRVDPGNPNVVLEAIQSVTLCRVYESGAGCPDVTDAGLLDPGTYAFQYELRFPGTHLGNLPASAGFSLTLGEIPEPATLVLIAIGLAGLAARRRRRHSGH